MHREKTDFIPLAKIKVEKVKVSQSDNTFQEIYEGSGEFDISYFNDRIFRWEPIVEKTELTLLSVSANANHKELIDAEEPLSTGEIESMRPIFINLSK